MPWTTPETFTAGQTLTAASMNVISGNLDALARGVMDYSIKTSNQTGFNGTPADVTGLDVSWTAESDRLYRVSLHLGKLTQNTNSAYVYAAITDAANNNKAWFETLLAPAYTATVNTSLIVTGLSGSVTYKARVYNNNATTDLTANGNQPSYILAEDIGPA